jgi:hypothetical protein
MDTYTQVRKRRAPNRGGVILLPPLPLPVILLDAAVSLRVLLGCGVDDDVSDVGDLLTQLCLELAA